MLLLREEQARKVFFMDDHYLEEIYNFMDVPSYRDNAKLSRR
jgi:hypothetical protein